jgi:hypothetical protein
MTTRVSAHRHSCFSYFVVAMSIAGAGRFLQWRTRQRIGEVVATPLAGIARAEAPICGNA